MATFKKGQKVKCIDDHFSDDEELPFKAEQLWLPKKGKTYTVRRVVRTDYGAGLLLEELRNSKFYFDNIQQYQEPIFSKERFERA